MDAVLGCEYRCRQCRQIPYCNWDGLLQGGAEWFEVDHHPSLNALSDSASDGCDLCKLIWWILFQSSDSTKLHDGGRLRNGGLTLQLRSNSARIIFAPEDDEQVVLELSVANNNLIGDRSGTAKTKELSSPRSFVSTTKEEDIDSLIEEVVKPWMTQCLDHPECVEIERREDLSRVPTRLINVSGDKLILRKNENGISQESKEYVILSYCWGEGNTGITNWANIQQRETAGFDKTELSATVQDAIDITRKMGVKYLWVDAMCIVQPSPATGLDSSDWAREAPHMGDYYRNAKCTIAASRARDSAHGFLGELFAFRHGSMPQSCVVGTYSSSGLDSRERYLELCSKSMPWPEEFLKQPLMQRGWCFQEWLLSRRVLHFTRSGTFWECHSVSGAAEAIQTHSHGSDSELQSFEPTEWTMSRDMMKFSAQDTKNNASKLPRLWANAVGLYCSMNLKYGSDRLIAIHGVATKHTQEDDYAAGVFRKSLAGLLWMQRNSIETPLSTDVPSWSWAADAHASSIGVMAQSPEPGILAYKNSLVDPIPKESFPGNALQFDTLENRMLRLRAPFLTVHLTRSLAARCNRRAFFPRDSFWGSTTALHFDFDRDHLKPQGAGDISMVLLGFNWRQDEEFPDLRGNQRFRMLGLLLRPAIAPREAWLRVGFVTVTVRDQALDHLLTERWKRDVVLI